MNIVVCIGNPCFSENSFDVIKGFQKLIRESRLEDVTVSASFCMKHCGRRGVCVKIGENMVGGVSADNLANIFEQYVLQPVSCFAR